MLFSTTHLFTAVQFVKVRQSEVFPVTCSLSDAELGAIPCAYGTAEGLLVRANLTADDHVLVVGASGGVFHDNHTS